MASVHSKVSVTKCKAESCGKSTRGNREESAKAAAATKAARKGEQQRVGQTPGTRKRPRSSPGSARATKDRLNPFTAYRLPSPPPRSSSQSHGNSVSERCVKSSRRESVFDLQEDSNDDDDIDFSATRKSGDTARGPIKTPKPGDGGVSSPYTLVDLSGIEYDDESSGVSTEEGGELAEQGLLEEFSTAPSEAPLSQALSGGGDTLRGDDKTMSPPFSPGCDRDQSSKSGVEEEEQGEKEGEEGREINKQDEEGKEILLASKLSFLVSGNTGRVHVYQEQDDDDGDGLDDSFEEEYRMPLHCRLVTPTIACLKCWRTVHEGVAEGDAVDYALRVLWRFPTNTSCLARGVKCANTTIPLYQVLGTREPTAIAPASDPQQHTQGRDGMDARCSVLPDGHRRALAW